jgi:hypothetical protein
MEPERKGAESVDEEGKIQGASVNSGDTNVEETCR